MFAAVTFAGVVLTTAAQSEPVDLQCDQTNAMVYFEAGSTELNTHADAAIADVVARTSGCAIDRIAFTTPAVNIQDNAARERAVLIALNDAGVLAKPGAVSTQFNTFADDRLASTPAARRIGVEFTLSPRAVG
ncbi:MAG: hypothetical protein AAF216_02625 [Pseudomonadota bacterium]